MTEEGRMRIYGDDHGTKRRVSDHGERRLWYGRTAETQAHDLAAGAGHDKATDKGGA